MTQSYFHTINAKDILTSIFRLSKKEQREFALNLLIDLANDNLETCSSDIAKEIIVNTTKFRAKKSEAGKKGNEVKEANKKAEEEMKVVEQNDGMLD